MNLYLNEMIERERRRDELVDIQVDQMLIANGMASRPWTHRLLAGLGGNMVRLGLRLQQRYSNLAAPSAVLLVSERQTPCPE